MPCIDCAASPCDVQLYAGKPGNYVPLICIAGSSIFPFIAKPTFIGLGKHAILGHNYFHCIINSVPAAGNSCFGPNKSNLPGHFEYDLDPKASPPGVHGGPCPAWVLQPPPAPLCLPWGRDAAEMSSLLSWAFLPRALVPAPSLGRGHIVWGGKEGISDFNSHILVLALAKEILIKSNL